MRGRPFTYPKKLQSTSPQEGRPSARNQGKDFFCISIHVPRKRDDMELGYDNTFEIIFQSTSPARGTTVLTGFL